ncbi:MAG: hypothetical protein M5U08_25785 [Burkholderiales bacterium]|nr:hypothetical protein [Burkholderiales bacterium]
MFYGQEYKDFEAVLRPAGGPAQSFQFGEGGRGGGGPSERRGAFIPGDHEAINLSTQRGDGAKRFSANRPARDQSEPVPDLAAAGEVGLRVAGTQAGEEAKPMRPPVRRWTRLWVA